MPNADDPRLTGPQCRDLTPVLTVHENPWFTVRKRGDFYTTEYRTADVAVLPVVDHESVVMVRVRRPVIEDVPLELPAGSARGNEPPVRAAARELREETGIGVEDSNRFLPLPPLAGSPNRNPNLLHLFTVDISIEEFEKRNAHDDEITAVELFTFEEVSRLLCNGDIYVALPVAVISRYIISRMTFR
jgi:8-oxo-dGTP pyrophosphatase MutT (NUDIX family)